MEAAFVEIGLEKNGFLYVDEIVGPELERGHGRKIQDLISRGQTILVQAVKDPMKTKGARLTTQISLPGRFVVFVPQGEGLGVSRRLDDDERQRLKDILKKLQRQGRRPHRPHRRRGSVRGGHRARPRLPPAPLEVDRGEGQDGEARPSSIYQEAELPLRVTRDLFTGDFEKAYVDNDQAFKRITGYLKKTSPHMVERVDPLQGDDAADGGVRRRAGDQVDAHRRVDLPSGGYLIFDYAEAFTVIDVNTGRFVGSRGKNSGARLEDTITKNNLEAVKEVVRQLRLRDIGGIIVIDFIDMANPKNRAAGRRGAAHGARARPDEDLRRRDLSARPRRDDASERHRRTARDHDAQVPDVRWRRHRVLGGVRRDRRRAPAARARRRLALAGVPRRARRADRGCARRPGGEAAAWSSRR